MGKKNIPNNFNKIFYIRVVYQNYFNNTWPTLLSWISFDKTDSILINVWVILINIKRILTIII